jgi:opacity protein-like surface antigen
MLLSIVLACIGAPVGGSAQMSPLQLEANVGASIPVQEFKGPEGYEGEVDTDTSFGVHFALTRGRLSWYAGFSEHRFACSGQVCRDEAEIVSTGWDVGVRLNLLDGPVVPWVRAGFVAYIARAELLGSDPSTIPEDGYESDRGWGYEVGAGLMFSLSERFALNPGVRYSKVDPEFAGPDFGPLDSRYIVADVGLVLAF